MDTPRHRIEEYKNPTNKIAEMLQLIPHKDEMLYLPPSQHELGNTDMPQ